jgi:hypothetical protein
MKLSLRSLAATLALGFAFAAFPALAQSKTAPVTQAPAVKPKALPPAPVSDADIAAAKAAGKVWVNLESKVYHKSDSKWYGKTKKGQFMTEAEAQKAGAHLAKG